METRFTELRENKDYGEDMVGIVILNYNSWEDTEACIHSILKAEPDLDYRIYVVDNASPMRPTEALIAWLKKQGVVLIQNLQNSGYSAGNNIGIRQALQDECDAVLISNSDVRYEPHSISVMYEYLKKNSDVGIVGPKIIRKNGTVQKECMLMKTGPGEKYLLRTRLYVLFPGLYRKYWGKDHDYDHEIFEVYAVLGCCFMFSRNCANEVTPLDEHPFLYEEELILGIQMEKLGWKTVYNPESVIHHLHSQSTEKVKAFAYTCNICSEIYFCKRYLNMKNWQIRPLYWYRSVLYALKMLKWPDFRNYRKEYKRKTKHEFDEK